MYGNGFGYGGGLGGLEESISFNEVELRNNSSYSYGIPEDIIMDPTAIPPTSGGDVVVVPSERKVEDKSLISKTVHATKGGKVITVGDVLLYGGLSYLAYMALSGGLPQVGFGSPARANPKRRRNKRRRRRNKRSRNPHCK